MNSVPDVFLDAVCFQLDRSDLECLKKTSTRWSSNAGAQNSKRRELKVFLDVNQEGSQVGIRIEDLKGNTLVSSAVQPKSDRFTLIEIGFGELQQFPEEKSMEYFKKKVVPVLRSLVFKCTFSCATVARPYHRKISDLICSALHGHSQLVNITSGNLGGKCPEFIEHQVALGHLKALSLRGDAWPEAVQASLKSFVQSPRFQSLNLRWSNLTVDFDMVSCVVERFLKGNFTKSGKLLMGKLSFPIHSLADLHVEEQGEYKEWRRFRQLPAWTSSGRRLNASYLPGKKGLRLYL
uniref:F-box domain-containing protein n=1 Tax=Steinernema glaseri TaxID=37863 RepID=A0A1I7Y5U7_9BILA